MRRSGNTSELRSIILSLRCALSRSLSDAPMKYGRFALGEQPRRSPGTSDSNGSATRFGKLELWRRCDEERAKTKIRHSNASFPAAFDASTGAEHIRRPAA